MFKFKSNAAQVIKKLKAKLDRVKIEAPKILANEGQKVFMENFNSQSWNGLPWPKRQSGKNHNPLLIGRTRRLKNSVANSIRQASVTRIKWGSYIPYAAIHNYGGKINKPARRGEIHFKLQKNGKSRFAKKKHANFVSEHDFKAHSFQMPKRQFMGDSLKLRKRLRTKFLQIYHNELRK